MWLIILLTLSSFNFTQQMPLEANCTLSKLYKGVDERRIIREQLAELFGIKFQKLITEVSSFAPYIIPVANHFDSKIKTLYIEEGIPLDSIKDFQTVLNRVSYLNFDNK